MKEKNFQFIGNFYDEEAIYCPPNQVCLHGKKEITQHWQKTVNFLNDFQFQTQKIEGEHSLFYEHGIAIVTYPYDKKMVTDTSKYLMVWKKIAPEEYRIIADMYNQY